MGKTNRAALALASRGKILAEYDRLYKLCLNLETIIENSQDSLFVTDGEGYIVKVNKAYEKLSGEKREDLLGLHMRDLENSKISVSATLRALEKRKQVTIEQTLFKTNRTTHVTTTPVFDAAGVMAMAISNNRDLKEIATLKERLADTEELANRYKHQIDVLQSQNGGSGTLVAADAKMLDTLHKADKIAKVDATVLILGETGSGKEQLVKYIHQSSNRRDERLVKINCGALSATLIESELFGYEKGSFTGASTSGKAGFFEAADNGTLFFDEIGEMPMEMQVKLLRVLQEGEFFRIGGTKSIKTNVRIISATNKNLKEMVQQGLFRSDLYYRLNVTSILVPPLRERIYDIIPLANKFLDEFNKKYGMGKIISASAYHALQSYNWPGNVRELRSVIEQALIMCEGDTVTHDELPFASMGKFEILPLDDTVNLDAILARLESSYILRAYEKHRNVRAAAKSLGMKTTRYLRKKSRYGKSPGGPLRPAAGRDA
ncbi:MAG: sigma 54-interacting transcriptional regulator [Deltaproteobacteria bacterium]|nr:sigma 54-interacting transcriptional regulator [Deltaproteobacteria bacterium]